MINFYKGLEENYSSEQHSEGIYQCTDTGNTYVFGVLNKDGEDNSLTIGETTGTAYEGNKGKALADAVATNPNTVVTSFGTVTQNADNVVVAFTDADKNTGNNQYTAGDGGNITLGVADTAHAGVMSSTDKTNLDNLVSNTAGYQTATNVDTKISEAITPLETELENKVDSDTIASSTEYGLVKTSGEADESDGQNYDLKGTGDVPHVSIPLATTSKDGLMSAEDKVNMDKLTNIQPEDLLAYGVEWDVTVADPALTRIGNMQYHKTLPIQNAFKGCIYADGQIQYYLNPDDWRFREVPVYIEVSYNSDNHTISTTGNFTDVVANANCYVDQYIKINNHICKITSASSNSITIPSTDINNEPVELESGTYTVEIGSCRNGADGIVCVEIPEFYYKAEADGNKHRMWVSSIQIDNTWTKQESLLIDAYKPTMRRVATAPSNGTNGGYIN